MAVVINKATGLAEDLQDAEAALKAGTHEVALYSPEGRFGSSTIEDAPRLLSEGFRQPDEAELKQIHKEGKYGTGEQQLKAGLEGLASGVAGPLAPLAEKALGVKPEDIRGREEVNPGTHMLGETAGLVGGLLFGTGEGALLAKAGKKSAEAVAKVGGKTLLNKIGQGAARGAVETALFQTGDEISKLIKEDPDQSLQTALVNVGLSGLFGGAAGGAFGAGGAAWDALMEGKAGSFIKGMQSKADEYLGKVTPITDERTLLKEVKDPFTGKIRSIKSTLDGSEKANFDPFKRKTITTEIPVVDADKLATKEGQKTMEGLVERALSKLNNVEYGAVVGSYIGGLPGWAIGKYGAQPILDSVMPAIIKPLLEHPVSGAGFKSAIQFGKALLKGEHALNRAAKAVFDGTSIELAKVDTKHLQERLAEVEARPEELFKTGDSVGHYLPGQAASIGGTTAAAVQYLSSLKPSVDRAAPLDPIRQPNKVEEANYQAALKIAEQPLQILNKVQQGTLTLSDIQHLRNLYPALYTRIQTKLMDSMITHMSEKKAIPYKTKMALSMFFGQPLDSSMTPQSIQSTQPPPPAPGPQPTNQRQPHKVEKLDKYSQQFRTIGQTRELSRTKAQ